MKNFKSIKTCYDIQESIGDILELMRKANNAGLSAARFTIGRISVIELIKAFEMLVKIHGDSVRLYEPGAIFNEDYFEIEVEVASGYFITIQSEKVSKLIPKINLINYN